MYTELTKTFDAMTYEQGSEKSLRSFNHYQLYS